MLNELELTGRARSHVLQRDDLGAAVHGEVIEPYLALKAAASSDGLDLHIASGFRDFDSQARIWNQKFRGERPIYDAVGNVREYSALAGNALVEAILCWSALPGASRHHWGTDIDVIDHAAMPEGYRYQLVPEEYEPGGVFYRLHVWLEENLESFGFFRPYRDYRGGVFPEPWHLSYGAISSAALPLLNVDLLAATLRGSEVLGKEFVLEQLPEIYRRYVVNVPPMGVA